jgi:hypothetical protein
MVETGDAILLEFDDGYYVRRTSPLVIDGTTYILKVVTDPILPFLDSGVLHDLLIQEVAFQ